MKSLSLLGLHYNPSGWVGGSNGNKADLSPAEAGAGLSMARIAIMIVRMMMLLNDSLMRS